MLTRADWGTELRDEQPLREGPLLEARPGHVVNARPPFRNIFACLVHENVECVVDLVRNLRFLDPASTVLLYNGGEDPRLLQGTFPFEALGVVAHPAPRPMQWGRLHDFALDCMRHAIAHLPFDTLTIVDSDQLALRTGYSARLASSVAQERGVGMFGNHPFCLGPDSKLAVARAAYNEIELWRPFLERFPGGESKFVHWSFWPSSVFTAEAARALVKICDEDTQLQEILRSTKVLATEEVVLPTLVALLGFRLAANPCSYEIVRFRVPYSVQQIDAAMCRHDVFWAHPIPRRHDDPLRQHVRGRFDDYTSRVQEPAPAAPPAPFMLKLPILARMRAIEGWLEDEEAELLIGATAHALATLPAATAVVEIGSYCGRATVVLGSVVKDVRPTAKVWSVDPHDSRIGTADRYMTVGPSFEKLRTNIAAAGLADVVEIVRATAPQVPWQEPVALILIDGLHDYASVSRDFHHFAPHLVDGAYVAFHDYGSYFPGVAVFVDELLTIGAYRKVGAAGTMVVLRKQVPAKYQRQ
jgi:Methyltransferase domain